jgi:hypothetical protein
MTRTLSFVFALGIAMGLALSVTPAHAGPGTEFQLLLLLNGERVRTLQSDGGGLMLYANDGGAIASATVPANAVVTVDCIQSVHLCVPSDGTWDGGCNTTVSDINYGSLCAAGTSRTMSLRGTTTTIKGVRPSGTGIEVVAPIYIMR